MLIAIQHQGTAEHWGYSTLQTWNLPGAWSRLAVKSQHKAQYSNMYCMSSVPHFTLTLCTTLYISVEISALSSGGPQDKKKFYNVVVPFNMYILWQEQHVMIYFYIAVQWTRTVLSFNWLPTNEVSDAVSKILSLLSSTNLTRLQCEGDNLITKQSSRAFGHLSTPGLPIALITTEWTKLIFVETSTKTDHYESDKFI